MNEFYSNFWPYFIAITSLVGIVACSWLAWHYGREKLWKAQAEQDAEHQHVWDGDLYELNNAPPRWWLWMFHLTVVFSLGYLVLYPGLGDYEGTLGWTQQGQHDAQRAAFDARSADLYAEFAKLTPEELANNPRAVSVGSSLFLNTCAQCHGSDARGSRGFPNLTDQDWLYGGDVEALRTSIAKGRHGLMPPMGAAVGNANDVRNVAAYVLSLSGSPTDAARAALGRPLFANTCAACHGAEGKGNTALGAPNLTDKTWLYGGSQADIIDAIMNGRQGSMPAHEERLTPQQIDLLVAYVLKTSGSATP